VTVSPSLSLTLSVERKHDTRRICHCQWLCVIEGPHLYRRGDWYYLSAAEGSSWKGHMQTIGRSRSVWGPYQASPTNPVLSHRNRVAHPFQTLGHAELLDDAEGNWWALALGTRSPAMAAHHVLGRETFLAPVSWPRDGWPEVGERGWIEQVYTDLPLPTAPEPDPAGETDLWLEGWRSLGPVADGVEGKGSTLTLPAGADLDAPGPPGCLLRAQSEHDQEFALTLRPQPGLAVGAAVLANRTHHYSALARLVPEGVSVRWRRVVDDLVAESEVVLPVAADLRLRLVATAEDYSAWIGDREIGRGTARLLAAETVQWFTNVNFAAVAVDEGAGPAPVTFQDITLQDRRPLPPRPFAIPT